MPGRSLRLAFAVACVVAGSATVGAQETYDLSGKVPEPNTVLRSELSLVIEPGDFHASAGEAEQTGIVRVETIRSEEGHVEKHSPPDKYKYVLHILDDYTTYDYVFEGEPFFQESGQVTRYHPLDRREIRFTLTKDGQWRRTLLPEGYKEGQRGRYQMFGPNSGGKNPDKIQEHKIELRSIWELGNHFYPQEEIPVGHEWTTDGAPLLRILFGENWITHSGETALEFVEVTEYRGEPAASLEISGTLVGRGLDSDDDPIAYKLDVSGTVIRSLESGIDRQIDLTGTAELRSVMMRDDKKVDVSITGPVTIQYLGRVK